MDAKFSVNLQEYAVTGVTCPDCGKKYTVRLSIDYLVRHEGEELKVICCQCAQKQINKERTFNAN